LAGSGSGSLALTGSGVGSGFGSSTLTGSGFGSGLTSIFGTSTVGASFLGALDTSITSSLGPSTFPTATLPPPTLPSVSPVVLVCAADSAPAIAIAVPSGGVVAPTLALRNGSLALPPALAMYEYWFIELSVSDFLRHGAAASG